MGDGVGSGGGVGCVGYGVVVRAGLLAGWWGGFNVIRLAAMGLGAWRHRMLLIEIGLHRCNEIFGLLYACY